MSDFTPGPWRAADTTYPEVWDVVTEDDSTLIVTDADEANARLIAAAPRMADYIRKYASSDSEALDILREAGVL